MGFSGLNQVMQGLFASQEAIRISGENIQNASTPGYARRVATFSAASPTGNIGVNVSGVVKRDSYLDSKVWIESGITTEWETKQNYYDRLMGVIDEPTDYSISNVTNNFFTTFQTLATEPSNVSYRVSAIEIASQFTNLLNTMSSQIETIQAEINEDVYTNVKVVNSLIDEIADLSMTIYQTEIAGRDASHTRDTLQSKIQQLSEYGNVTVQEKTYGRLSNGAEDKRMMVTFGGMIVVSHGNATKLTCVKRENKKNEDVDVEGLYDIKMETGSTLDLTSGKLKALLEIRDGDGEGDASWIKGTVYYMRELNEFARTFAKAFNEGFIGDAKVANGFADAYSFSTEKIEIIDPVTGAIDYEKNPDGTFKYQKSGFRFFTTDNMTAEEFTGKTDAKDRVDMADDAVNKMYENMTAKNISISADILNNIENMACSFTDPEYENDVQAILDLVSFRENKNIFSSGDVDGFVEGMITSVGLDAQKAASLSEMHGTLLEQAQTNQSAYSDVSIDEETTFTIQFQQMYKACANLVNIYSELYNSLLNAI